MTSCVEPVSSKGTDGGNPKSPRYNASERKPLTGWFPETPYYHEHNDRLADSFGRLPPLPQGFSCLSIGSWGMEAPYLIGELGSGRVCSIRAPEEGLPTYERRSVIAPNGFRADADVYALDIERDSLPESLTSAFDLVICWEVLEHLNFAPAKLIWQAIRCMSPGGVISITTPNALWHYYTVAQLSGVNALGLKFQHHIPFATHWRLYSPAEVRDLVEGMGCTPLNVTSFRKTEAYSWKSWLFLKLITALRRKSGNGDCSTGQYIHVLARKDQEAGYYQPTWLCPATVDTCGA